MADTPIDYEQLSVKELKALLTERGVSFSDCVEKSDLIRRANESANVTREVPRTGKVVRSRVTINNIPCVTYNNSTETPDVIVIILHGFGADENDLASYGPLILEGCEGIRVRAVFPRGILEMEGAGAMWWPLDVARIAMAFMSGNVEILRKDVPNGIVAAREAINGLISELFAETGVPVDRMVLGGFSQGSWLSCDVALHMEAKLGGLFLFSSTLLCEDVWTPLMAAKAGMHIVQTHGLQDPLLPFMAGCWLRDAFNGAGVDVKFLKFRGGHTLPNEAGQELIERVTAIGIEHLTAA